MRGNRKGFTVIEMLVVLGLFALLGVVIVNVYLLALSAQRQTAARQQVTSSIRYAVESIARQIRVGEIDYKPGTDDYKLAYLDDQDPGIQGSEEELHLKDANGNMYGYFVDGGVLKFSYNGATASDLTNPAEVKVVDLLFYIDPSTDPFVEERCNDALPLTGCYLNSPVPPVCTVNDNGTTERLGFCGCSDDSQCASQHCDATEGICLPFDNQPRVTMVIGFESTAIRDIEIKRVYLQTTVSSRTYRR